MTIAEQFRQEGFKKGIQEVAKNLVQLGLNPEQVSKAMGLSLTEIEKLKKKLH